MSGYAWACQIILIQNSGLFLLLLNVYQHAKNQHDLRIASEDPVKSLAGNNTEIKSSFSNSPYCFMLEFSGLDLMTCDSYFSILVEVFTIHILAEDTYFTNHVEWTEHKTMVLKPANKYQIIRQQLFATSIISLSSKSFVNIFYWAENNKLKR